MHILCKHCRLLFLSFCLLLPSASKSISFLLFVRASHQLNSRDLEQFRQLCRRICLRGFFVQKSLSPDWKFECYQICQKFKLSLAFVNENLKFPMNCVLEFELFFVNFYDTSPKDLKRFEVMNFHFVSDRAVVEKYMILKTSYFLSSSSWLTLISIFASLACYSNSKSKIEDGNYAFNFNLKLYSLFTISFNKLYCWFKKLHFLALQYSSC